MKIKIPETIPQDIECWQQIKENYQKEVERKERKLETATMTILLTGIPLAVSGVLVSTTNGDIGLTMLITGLLLMLAAIPISEYASEMTIRLMKIIDEAPAEKYWSERREAESCRNIGIVRKRRGIDPEDDTYYEHLARRHESAAQKILATNAQR